MRKICTFLCVLGLVASANASVLDFTGAGTAGVGVNQSYGDNMAGTPNTTVYYNTGADPELQLPPWTTGYGDLVDILYPWTTPLYGIEDPYTYDGVYADIEMTFTATGGQLVQLYGFDMGSYGGDYSIPWKVEDGLGNLLDSGVLALIQLDGGGNPTHSSASISATAAVLKLSIDTSTLLNNAPNVGVDNVEFSEVPEPATMALLGLGVLGLLRRKVRA